MEFISWLMEKIYIFAAQNAETSLLLHVRRKTVKNIYDYPLWDAIWNHLTAQVEIFAPLRETINLIAFSDQLEVGINTGGLNR
jgi:hypothetical protein